MILAVISLTACSKKEAVVEEPVETKEEVKEQESTEDEDETSEVEVDSKNAYEYSKLESILQDLKRETDTD